MENQRIQLYQQGLKQEDIFINEIQLIELNTHDGTTLVLYRQKWYQTTVNFQQFTKNFARIGKLDMYLRMDNHREKFDELRYLLENTDMQNVRITIEFEDSNHRTETIKINHTKEFLLGSMNDDSHKYVINIVKHSFMEMIKKVYQKYIHTSAM